MFLNETILIEPCPLGLDIIFDFAACTIDAFLFTGYDMQTCLNHAFSLLKQIIPIYNDRVYIEKPICHLFFNITNPALIPIFRDHIVNYSVEKRIHERNTLHDFVRSHSSEQVNSTTVKQFMDDFRSGETKK